MAAETPPEPNAASPVRELMADPNYRNFWISQVLFFGVNGTLRFVFIWLIVTLTKWPSAEGLIGIAMGLPALLLSIPAGAWSDRVDRRSFSIRWMFATSALFVAFTVVVATGNATPLLAGLAAVLVGASTAIISPNVGAMVPSLVKPRLLMNATALQNGGGQAAGFLGLLFGGLAIEALGTSAGFGLLAIMSAASGLVMMRLRLPHKAAAELPTLSALGGEMAAGLRYGLSTDPLRTLLILSLVLGSSFSVMQISIPRIVETDFGLDSGAAGLLLGTFGIGMFISSAIVAGRGEMRHGINIALFIGVGLGMGQFLLSLAPNYALSVAVMVAWGINAGIAIASHRTLLQRETAPEMMGRIMGIMTLGFAGGLPFGALAQSVLAPAVGPVMTMRIVGLVTVAITLPLTWRKSMRAR